MKRLGYFQMQKIHISSKGAPEKSGTFLNALKGFSWFQELSIMPAVFNTSACLILKDLALSEPF